MKALKGCHSQRSQKVSTKTLWDIKRPLKALLALPVMTMTKLLYGLVIVELLGGLSFAHRNPEPCPSIEYVDYNAHRIPTRITGLYCLTQRIIGMSCRHDSKVILKSTCLFSFQAMHLMPSSKVFSINGKYGCGIHWKKWRWCRNSRDAKEHHRWTWMRVSRKANSTLSTNRKHCHWLVKSQCNEMIAIFYRQLCIFEGAPFLK